MSLDGLDKILANSPLARERLLHSGRLLAWPSSKTVGVISGDSLRLNTQVIKLLADVWYPQWEGPAMVPIDMVKDQAYKV